jgi:hypothetical protein
MIAFLGENYYIDVDELENQVSLSKSKVLPLSGETETEQISVTRYETFKLLLDVVLSEREEVDENLGLHGAKALTIPFKLSFNTLLLNKIIKKF